MRCGRASRSTLHTRRQTRPDALDQQTELKISVLHYEVDLRLDTARAQRE